jgi:hypothetical protein
MQSGEKERKGMILVVEFVGPEERDLYESCELFWRFAHMRRLKCSRDFGNLSDTVGWTGS